MVDLTSSDGGGEKLEGDGVVLRGAFLVVEIRFPEGDFCQVY